MSIFNTLRSCCRSRSVGQSNNILFVCCLPLLFRITAAVWQEFAESPASFMWELILSLGSLATVAFLVPDDSNNEMSLYYGFWVAVSVFALYGLITLVRLLQPKA